MKKLAVVMTWLIPVIAMSNEAPTPPVYYGVALCANPQYECIKIQSGQKWETLFPDEAQRDLVQRINRSYNNLWPGKQIAVPKNLAELTLIDVSPFPHSVPEQEKQIIVDQNKLAWGAYDETGHLVKWGPISSGRDKCPDSNNQCLTLTGVYRVFSKENEHCKSDIFPIGKGGAKMPYCMYFHKGFALHGSDDIPGYRASHGCVRMFVRDAKWLNETFVETSVERNRFAGTKVVVLPVSSTGKPVVAMKSPVAAKKKTVAVITKKPVVATQAPVVEAKRAWWQQRPRRQRWL